MKLQSLKKALLSGTALAMLASFACAEPSETAKYARQLGLPKEISAAVSQLEYGAISRSLLRELSYLSKDLQTHEVTLNYLKEISRDKTVNYVEVHGIKELDHDGDGLNLEEEDELKTDPLKPNPEVKKIVDYLGSVSDETLVMYKSLGIDGDVVSYLNLVSTLPQDFADYAIKSKLCIQDKNLTEEEEKFLQDSKRYLQEMYEYNIAEIAKIDPELAIKLEQIPFLKDGIELKDVEALEDILYLASNPQNQWNLEDIYGKGIERGMWAVALERIFYKGFENEFDVNNPFEGSELYVNLKLAGFQEKYNPEMEAQGISGPKPAMRGINYICEPRHEIDKSTEDIRFDYALMRWVLRSNAVKLYNNGKPQDDDFVFQHIDLAREEGLEVYMQFEPLGHNPGIDLEEFKVRLANFAKRVQSHNIKILSVGNEVELWSQAFGGGLFSWGPQSFESRRTGKVTEFVDELVEIARENCSSLITYADYWSWGLPKINWDNMDAISLNIYIGSASDTEFSNYLLALKNGHAIPYKKPFIISEVGSLTITEAEKAGGDDSYTWKFPVHHDPEKQAQMIARQLKLIYQVGVDGIFVFAWDRPEYWHDQNNLGHGIWDYVKKEPKPSFWSVYKYYKD